MLLVVVKTFVMSQRAQNLTGSLTLQATRLSSPLEATTLILMQVQHLKEYEKFVRKVFKQEAKTWCFFFRTANRRQIIVIFSRVLF